MERIHNIDKKPWISQDSISIKELAEKRTKELREHGVTLATEDRLHPSSTCDEKESENFSDLRKKLELFTSDGNQNVRPYFLFNSTDARVLTHNPNCKLKMYSLQLEHAKRMIEDRAYKIRYLTRLKTTRREVLMRHLALSNRMAQNDQETIGVDDMINLENQEIERNNPDVIVILVVQMWPQPARNNKLRLEREILFRADQCLTELRDQFKCQKDYGVPMDLSDDPEQHSERIFRGELFKSGFFLIGDIFYNDMRDPNNTDLSAPIMSWANEEVLAVDENGRNTRVSRGIGPFKSMSMEETKFEDLTIRLGAPYLYFHQGNCEHLFTISDIRYVPNDVKLRQTRFPFVTATAIGRKEDNIRCYMCKNRPPHWYTRNNNRLPVDPFFFCEYCFQSFNYDQDKKKIGSFQAYLYTRSSGIPENIVIGSKEFQPIEESNPH